MKTKNGWISMIVASLWILAGSMALAATNNYNYGGQGFGYGHGAVMPPANMTFTNAGIRDVTVSAGQLSGVNPQTGAALSTNNLLPFKAQKLTVSSAGLNSEGNNAGVVISSIGGNGAGINLDATGSGGSLYLFFASAGTAGMGTKGFGIFDASARQYVMAIRSNQYVGFGTVLPTERLDVLGNVKATGFIGSGAGLSSLNASAITSGTLTPSVESDPQVGANTANYLSKWNGSALVSGVIYDNGANIGIGTNNPANNKLKILSAGLNSAGDNAGVGISSVGGNGAGINLDATGSGGSRYLFFASAGTAGMGTKGFGIYDSSASQYVMAVNSNQSVGFGTITPTERLHVAGNVKATGFIGSGVGLTINPAQGDIPMLQ